MTAAVASVLNCVEADIRFGSSGEAASEPAPQSRLVPVDGENGAERRRAPRFSTLRPVVVMPVLPNGALDLSARTVGTLIDTAEGGMGLELDVDDSAVPRSMVVGVPMPDGNTRYAGLELRHFRRTPTERCRVGAHFSGPAHQILKAQILVPEFDPQSMTYRQPYEPEVLKHWVQLGILKPRLLDRVQVCPQCGTLATFRLGCRVCRSGRVQCERVFAVGGFSDQHQRIICLDCGWRGNEPAPIGHCFRCGLRFPGEQAKHIELVGYDVLGLDPLALIHAS
jgi:hypothetical protein